MGKLDDGMRIRREVLGDEHADRSAVYAGVPAANHAFQVARSARQR
ncbi:MAG TPA: hypothetical protein VLD86_03385 [Ilumatobacteraceae bacterium]|nr:hypothetical protein [Ilumatobacteraceae bacterium]